MDVDDDRTLDGRRRRSQVAAAALSRLDDEGLAALLRGGRRGRGIGGSHAVLEVGGVTVFAKSVPLTEEERRAPGSTADLFGLPVGCGYGVGSPSRSAWRELAAHRTTTRWVREGTDTGFPLLHHWRVVPRTDEGAPPEHADVEAAVAVFGGDRAVARRIEATAAARWSLVLFLEHVPWNVEEWLGRELARGDDAAVAAVTLLRRTLPRVLHRMNERGLLHMDAHLGNVLTDGHTVHVTDFGLATSTDFELGAAERTFVDAHRLHDPAHAIARIVNQVVTARCGVVDPERPDHAARNAYVRTLADGAHPAGVPPPVADVLTRFAPLTALMNDVYWQLFDGAPVPPFPTDEVADAVAASGLLDPDGAPARDGAG